MSIYAEKREGKLTGYYRVELQRGTERYRKRHKSLLEAEEDEKRVRLLWVQETPVASLRAPQAKPRDICATLSEAISEAKGVLWRGQRMEDTNWQRMAHIQEILGKHRRLDDIDTRDVAQLRNALIKRGKMESTCNRYCSLLRTFLTHCYDFKLRSVPVNKDTIKLLWVNEGAGKIRWITQEEEKVLLELLPDNVAKLVKIAIWTGCRRDELLTAKLDQINGTRLHLWDTKTSKTTKRGAQGQRTVFMTPEISAMLTELITTKTMPTRRYLRTCWDNARREMNLEHDKDFTFHTTRHTCATRLLDAGVSPLVIQKWLGHSRIETTLRYAHVKDQNLEQALEMVGEFMVFSQKKASVSKDVDVPTSVPHGGGIDHFSAAA